MGPIGTGTIRGVTNPEETYVCYDGQVERHS
jgi:hypothetical protein